MIRTVNFAHHATFAFENSMFPHALVLADVDGDGVGVFLCLRLSSRDWAHAYRRQDPELVVASAVGHVGVFKGVAPTPWRTGTLAATVSAAVRAQWGRSATIFFLFSKQLSSVLVGDVTSSHKVPFACFWSTTPILF